VEGIERYVRRAVVTWHGFRYRLPYGGHQQRDLFQYMHAVPADLRCHGAGTGVSGWHTSLGIAPEDFPHPNMADSWLAVWADQQQVPVVALAHEAGWIEPLPEARQQAIYQALGRGHGSRDTLALRTWVERTRCPWPDLEETGWTAATTSELGGMPGTPEAAPAAPAVPAPRPRGRSSSSCGRARDARSGRSSTSAAETERSAGR